MRTSLARANPLIAAIILQIACRGDITAPAPETPPTLPEGAIALSIDVNGVKVSQLTSTTSSTPQSASASTLGSGVRATVSNVVRSSPVFGRVRVTFDLALTNTFSNIDLIPSTFPLPPTAQVVAYPFTTNPAGLFGLKVIPTADWDGNPWNFFNDPVCIALTPPSDCYRWEPFGPSIPAGSTTSPRRVGFDVDASVTSFTVYIAIAADYQEKPATPQAPIISLSDFNPIFTITAGVGVPEARTVQVTNIGGGAIAGLGLTVSYGDGPTGWLDATLNSATAPATIRLQPNIGGLQAGTYLAKVSVASTSAANSPQNFTVALIINAPVLNISTHRVEFRAGYRGPARSGDLTITSAISFPVSGLAVHVVYGGEQLDWLRATLSSNTTPATVSLVADPGTLPPGIYQAEVDVTAPGGALISAIVQLGIYLFPDLTFTGTPTITVTPTSVSMSNLTVANQAYGNATSFNVGFCLSRTPSIDKCELESFVTRTLNAFTTEVLPTLTIEDSIFSPVSPGIYYVFAAVDPTYSATVEESDETNNILPLGQITVPTPAP